MNKTSRWKIYNSKVLVDTFQLKLVGVACIHFAVVAVVFLSTLFIPIAIRLHDGTITSPQVQEAAHEFLVLHLRLWGPLLGALALLVLHTLLSTHRVAGPLCRFRRYLKAVGAGDLSSPFTIRKHDFLHKEASAASEMVETLRQRIEGMEEQLDQASAAWARLNSASVHGSPPESESIRDLGESLQQCRASLAAFTTGNRHNQVADSTPGQPADPPGVEDLCGKS